MPLNRIESTRPWRLDETSSRFWPSPSACAFLPTTASCRRSRSNPFLISSWPESCGPGVAALFTDSCIKETSAGSMAVGTITLSDRQLSPAADRVFDHLRIVWATALGRFDGTRLTPFWRSIAVAATVGSSGRLLAGRRTRLARTPGAGTREGGILSHDRTVERDDLGSFSRAGNRICWLPQPSPGLVWAECLHGLIRGPLVCAGVASHQIRQCVDGRGVSRESQSIHPECL